MSPEQTEQAAGVMLAIFCRMNSTQRAMQIKALKAIKPKLDLNYPEGVSNDVMKLKTSDAPELILPEGHEGV